MNERQRMQYLETMGVDSFMPRWVLPGAQTPRQCMLPAAATAVKSRLHPANRYSGFSEVAGAHRQPSGLVDTLLETIASQPAAAGEKVASLAVDLAKKTDEKAAFSLAFWRVHPQVMVVDTRQPRRALPTEALLRAIVGSLGLAQTLPLAEIQNWPLAGGGDQGWDAAREMIQAFLESRLIVQSVRYLVLMGGDAVKTVLDETGDAATIGSRVSVDTFACDALIAPSLTQLLLEPQQKALLWPLLSDLAWGPRLPLTEPAS